MRKQSVTVDKMTWLEVEEAIKRAPIAYIPLGPQECHGANMPMGTDIFVPTAVALMASEKTGGVVYNPLSYCFTGATSSFRGTLSIPMSLQTEILKAIAKNLHSQKFEAICFVSIHAPNAIPVGMAVRELFEYDRITTGFFNPYSFVDEDEHGYDDVQKETAMCHAAMERLGLAEHIPSAEDRGAAETPPVSTPSHMTIGYHFTDISQHQPIRSIEIETGRRMLERAAEALAGGVMELKEYSNKFNGKPIEFVYSC